MAVRSAISIGFPSANYVVQLGHRASILLGEFIVENGQAVITVVTGQFGNLTLAATATVLDTTALTATIPPITISAVGNIAVSVSLGATIADLILSASGIVTVSASVDATIGPITSSATAVAVPLGGGPAVYPWWWSQYVRRHEAERRRAEQRAREEWLRENTVEGYGRAIMPASFGRAEAIHDPDGDIIEFVAALLPCLQAA